MPPNFYDSLHLTPVGFDRAAERRADQGWFEGLLGLTETRVHPVWRGKTLITGPRHAPRLTALSASLIQWRDHPGTPALMGVQGGIAHVAVDVSHLDEPKSAEPFASTGVFVDLRSMGSLLPPEEGAWAAYARAMAWFHARHRFCGVCGAPTMPVEAGHARRCTDPACGAGAYPRNDPAVIVLITHGDACLLARNPRFPGRMHSTLAGFAEAGESLEATVEREMFEEVGVRVTDIRYRSSQPWPFPQSLMVGFTARALNTDLMLEEAEIAEAGWYSKAFLRGLDRDLPWDSGAFTLPRPDSIARRLIEDWLAE